MMKRPFSSRVHARGYRALAAIGTPITWSSVRRGRRHGHPGHLAGMMEKLGQPIVVQNVSGAGGTRGGAVAAAKPDGYARLLPTGTMCLQPHVMKLPTGRMRSTS